MKNSSIIWTVVIIVVVVVAGFWWWSASMSSSQPAVTTTQMVTSTPSMNPATNPSAPGTTAPQPTVAATLTLNNSGGGTFGAYLSASNGMTLYQYTKDAVNVSNCTGACATAWPPYIVSAAVAAAPTTDPGIAGKIGTITRADGSLQLTYRGLPLYFFTGDAKPGDTKGEAVNGFTEVAP